MSFQILSKPNVGDSTKIELINAIIDNDNDLDSRIGSVTTGQILNGSFELVSNSLPINWDTSVPAGKSLAISTGISGTHHGASAVIMSASGSSTGAVTLTSSDYIEVGEGRPIACHWFMKSDTSTITNAVDIIYYDNSQSLVATDNIFSMASGNSLSWVEYGRNSTPPVNARYCKLKITGVNSATNGSVYYDGFELTEVAPSAFNIFSGTTTWKCPHGVFNVLLEMLGAGGAGGGAGGTSQNPGVSGGGGGAGGYSKVSYAVTPGNVYTVTIGVTGGGGGGAPNQTNGGAGGDTWFDVSSNKAQGGQGGSSAANGGTGGTGGVGISFSVSGLSINGGNGGNQSGGSIGAAGLPWSYFQAFTGYGNGGVGGLVNLGGVNGGTGGVGQGGIMFLSY